MSKEQFEKEWDDMMTGHKANFDVAVELGRELALQELLLDITVHRYETAAQVRGDIETKLEKIGGKL